MANIHPDSPAPKPTLLLMSRYPGNPWWCQVHDTPRAILTQFEWEEASEAGHLTLEHVLARLEFMLEWEIGNGSALGLDEEGFFRALTADRWQVEGALSVVMRSHDHPPPHVHVYVRGDRHRKLRINIETGELMDDRVPDGWARKLKRASEFVMQNRSLLLEAWSARDPVPASQPAFT